MSTINEIELLRRRVLYAEKRATREQTVVNKPEEGTNWRTGYTSSALTAGDAVVTNDYDSTYKFIKVQRATAANTGATLICRETIAGEGFTTFYTSGVVPAKVDVTGQTAGCTVGTQADSHQLKAGNTGLGHLMSTVPDDDGLYQVFFSGEVAGYPRVVSHGLSQINQVTQSASSTVLRLASADCYSSREYDNQDPKMVYIHYPSSEQFNRISASGFLMLTLGESHDLQFTVASAVKTRQYSLDIRGEFVEYDWDPATITWDNQPTSATLGFSTDLVTFTTKGLDTTANLTSFYAGTSGGGTLTIPWRFPWTSTKTIYGVRIKVGTSRGSNMKVSYRFRKANSYQLYHGGYGQTLLSDKPTN